MERKFSQKFLTKLISFTVCCFFLIYRFIKIKPPPQVNPPPPPFFMAKISVGHITKNRGFILKSLSRLKSPPPFLAGCGVRPKTCFKGNYQISRYHPNYRPTLLSEKMFPEGGGELAVYLRYPKWGFPLLSHFSTFFAKDQSI